MRKISALTLSLSDRCNFSCAYCPQRRGERALTTGDLVAFLDFLQPRLAQEVWLGFYGGEPLLSWPLVQKAVAHAESRRESRFRCSLTTNGSLLEREHVLFFRDHGVHVVLSYDGLAQEYRDPGSVAAVEQALSDLHRLHPEGYTVNSVFTPRTVPLLAASMEGLLRQGHRRLQYALDTSVPWREPDLAVLEGQLGRLAAAGLEHRRRAGEMPLRNLIARDGEGVFACFAARDRLALLPDRTVWGCYMFYDLLGHSREKSDYGKYCFGELETFMSAPPDALAAVAANYAELRQDYFFTGTRKLCSLCDDLERCATCPAAAALGSGTLAVIPDWSCRIQGMQRAAAAVFGSRSAGD